MCDPWLTLKDFRDLCRVIDPMLHKITCINGYAISLATRHSTDELMARRPSRHYQPSPARDLLPGISNLMVSCAPFVLVLPAAHSAVHRAIAYHGNIVA